MPHFDQAAFEHSLEQNFAGDWDIFLVTAGCFLESTDANLQELVDAYETADLPRMMRAAHRIKGEVSLFHMTKVIAEFKALEMTARAGALPPRGEFEQAKTSLALLVAEIMAIVA